MIPYKNSLLDALSAAAPGFMDGRLASFSFTHGDLLCVAGDVVEHVYFPTSGLISLIVDLSGGERIEAAMIGRDGMLGAGFAFGGNVSVSTGFGQIGGSGWRMAAGDLVALARDNAAVWSLLFRHEQYVLAQAQQTAACNATHPIRERMCSWLLRAHDLAPETDLYLTQEFLADILGVQRASVSLIAGTLQDAGIIQYRRGRVSILDKQALVQNACECYRALRRHQQRLFHHDTAMPVV